MRKYGFTIIELLVVIAVIALLTAIAVPSMMAAKNRAQSIRCSSNLHQLSLGFMVYQQEYEVYPYGFCDVQLGTAVPSTGYAGNAMYDKQGLWWFDYLQSSIEFDLEPGSILWCPAGRRVPKSVQDNLLCGNYGVNRSVCKDAQGIVNTPFTDVALRASQIRQPSGTLLISDSGYSLLSWLAATDTSQPVFENINRTNFFYVPGLAFNQTRNELRDNPDAIKGRHPHQSLNVGFTDGHNEVRDAESLMIEKTLVNQGQLPQLWVP